MNRVLFAALYLMLILVVLCSVQSVWMVAIGEI